MNRPLWRWWLFCLSLRFGWMDLMAWCVLPAWLGWDGEPFPDDSEGVPF